MLFFSLKLTWLRLNPLVSNNNNTNMSFLLLHSSLPCYVVVFFCFSWVFFWTFASFSFKSNQNTNIHVTATKTRCKISISNVSFSSFIASPSWSSATTILHFFVWQFVLSNLCSFLLPLVFTLVQILKNLLYHVKVDIVLWCKCRTTYFL